MKTTNTRRGFTLIELLVVVLIIGILAAVAVPQYRRAVLKSRAATVWPLLDDVYKAQQSYFLANGAYATNFDDLDIDVPGSTGNAAEGLCQTIVAAMAYGKGSEHKTDQWRLCMGIYQNQILIAAVPLKDYTGAGWLKTSHPNWPAIYCVHRTDEMSSNEYCPKMGYTTESGNYGGFFRSYQ